jgi:ribosomal protein L17
LDNDTTLTQFTEIEQKVERLIDVCRSLETKNRRPCQHQCEVRGGTSSLKQRLRRPTRTKRNAFAPRSTVCLTKLDEIKEE